MQLPGLPTSIRHFFFCLAHLLVSLGHNQGFGFFLPMLAELSTSTEVSLQACHTAGPQENSANYFNIYHH